MNSKIYFPHFSIRGRLGSLTPLARNVGVLIAYVVGATVDYEFIPAIFMYIPIVYMICMYFLPNTPQYHFQCENLKVRFLDIL